MELTPTERSTLIVLIDEEKAVVLAKKRNVWGSNQYDFEDAVRRLDMLSALRLKVVNS